MKLIKWVKKIALAIPYIIQCVKIVNMIRTKLDINGDGKISIEELKQGILEWNLMEEKKND